MKKTLKKLIAAACAVAMLGSSAGALAACGGGKGYTPPWKGKEVIPDPGYGSVGSATEDDVDKWDNPSSYESKTETKATTSGAPVTDYHTDVNKTASVKEGTYRTFTSSVPSLWNELDSMDNNDSQIMDYISSPFFEFDYKFEDGKKFNNDGTVNYDAIIPGAYEVKFSAATKLEDVTADVWQDWDYYDERLFEIDHTNETEADYEKYADVVYLDEDYEECAGFDEAAYAYAVVPYTNGYAWKLTLRDDLKWDNGDPIKAEDFVYSMQQQLDPKYSFQRASSYFGAVSIIGARDYFYQGQTVWVAALSLYGKYADGNDDKLIFSLGNPTENKDNLGGAISSLRTAIGVPDSWTAADFIGWLIGNGVEATAAELTALEGKSYTEIKADTDLKATFDSLMEWVDDDVLYCFVTQSTYPEIDFDGNVGLYATGDYELTVCYTTSEEFLNDDGSLSYLAAYELSSLPLVHKATFEANKKAPSAGQTLYTNTYQTDLASSRSWGPYKLTAYQAGNSYKLEKNTYWYGYDLKDNTNQYSVTAIECKQITETETQWMSFLNGDLDDIGIDVTHADDYRNSKYTRFTPGTYTFSWHLYSGLETLQQSGRNNTILAIDDFRKALSLAIDRNAYAAAVTTAYQGAYGYLNDMYYYDVVNGGVFRQTDEAKSGLLRAYGYEENADHTWSLPGNPLIQDKTLDEAYESLSGYNLEMAKEYVEKAYKRLTDYWVYYQYDSSKKIKIKFGTSADTDSTRREFNYIRDHVLAPLFKDTSLEGKVELIFDASFGNDWSSKFEAGEYELCTSAWGSAAFNPHYFIGAYVDPANAYTASYWDTESAMMTMTVPGEVGEFPGSGKVRTMSIMNWYRCLNGYEHPDGEKYTYDWSEGKIDAKYRNAILAKLEETVLEQYYSIPTITQNSASILGAKFSYGADEYNTFMGYGGMRYLKVNYTDSEWTAYVTAQGGNLETEYKKAA